MRQPIAIHPAEGRCQSANGINKAQSQGEVGQTLHKTEFGPSHDIKIDKSYRLLNSDDSRTGLIVSALVASTIFASFAIIALPWPFTSASSKRSDPGLSLQSSAQPADSKKGDLLSIHGRIIQNDSQSPAQSPPRSNISSSSANPRAKSSTRPAPPTSSTAKDQTPVKLIAAPETRPTTVEGWTLREITNGTAVLEGPGGIRKAARGDMIPGVGRVESIFRWGNHLIVATSGGLISTP